MKRQSSVKDVLLVKNSKKEFNPSGFINMLSWNSNIDQMRITVTKNKTPQMAGFYFLCELFIRQLQPLFFSLRLEFLF
ncbi:MAG: hypothetical protein JWR72_748 [Flavisolibacter sp.]|jgi:hypothetical protein|nr:hypothetical protein [Flavisolibacter sp.]